MTDFEKEQRGSVLKAIKRDERLKEQNLCRWCEENKATTYDQMYSPICQQCRDDHEERKR